MTRVELEGNLQFRIRWTYNRKIYQEKIRGTKTGTIGVKRLRVSRENRMTFYLRPEGGSGGGKTWCKEYGRQSQMKASPLITEEGEGGT